MWDLVTSCEELTHWKRPWCWGRLKAGGEGDNRGWDGWMASPTWWTWVWASFGSWWWTGKPGMLQPWGWKEEDMTERLNWLIDSARNLGAILHFSLPWTSTFNLTPSIVNSTCYAWIQCTFPTILITPLSLGIHQI